MAPKQQEAPSALELTPGDLLGEGKEPLPDASWRPTDWRTGAARRASERAQASREGAMPPPDDPELYVSPTEAQPQSEGPAEGQCVPNYKEYGSVGEPWHQQPGETHEAYQAFWTYVKLGPSRSLIRVCRRLRKTKAGIHRWSSAHHWRMRLYRYLAEEDRVRQQNHRHEQADMAERHAKIARAMNGKLIRRMQSMDVGELSAADVARWFKITSEIERHALDAERLRRPEQATRSMRREDALARTWARSATGEDPGEDEQEDL